MLRLKTIAPLLLPEEEMARRQERYDRLAAGRLSVTLCNLQGPGAPERLDLPGDVERSAELVGEEIERTDPGDFDAVMPDCVLDPCVGERRPGPVPLHGILRLAAGILASCGMRFAAVTRNRAIGDELSRKLDLYGLGPSLASVHLLEVDFCLIADQAGWGDALAPLAQEVADRGIATLLNGCSAVDLDDDRVGGVRVVDPTALALDALCLADRSGLVTVGSVR